MKTCFVYIFLLVGSISYAQQNLHLIKKTVIGGEGGWDYLSVDPQNNVLYISHSTQAEVLNSQTHEKIGAVTGLQGVHGVIAVPSAGRGLTTNGKSNSATIFDLKTLKPITELPTGKNPDALLYDNYSKRVFTFNHSDKTVTAIDITEGKVVGTVDVGGTALEAGVSDENGTIYLNLEDSHEIVSFDSKTLAIKNKWNISPGEEPTGLAIDRANKRLFTVCHNEKMLVIDTNNGKIVAELPIGKRVDGVVFDETLKLAISSNGEGSMTVVKEISPNEFKVVETVTTVRGAKTIALDPKTHHVFLSSAEYGETPPATTENPNPRPKVLPGTFMVLEYGF
ncbi:MAG: YncE family protein [Cyclobacteriaceae bacterium]